jgi:AraC-like DNA-binding protein
LVQKGQSTLVSCAQLKALVLADSASTLVSVARRLGMTRRTLQRRLKANGTTFREALAAARLELATQVLAEAISTAQAAAILGYSEAAAFHRAFKRWTGTTPGQYTTEDLKSGAALRRRERKASSR